MNKIFLLRLVKLAFVPIRNINKLAVFYRNDDGILISISASQNFDNLTDLRSDFFIQVDHLISQLRQNFHAVLSHCHCMFKMRTH